MCEPATPSVFPSMALGGPGVAGKSASPDVDGYAKGCYTDCARPAGQPNRTAPVKTSPSLLNLRSYGSYAINGARFILSALPAERCARAGAGQAGGAFFH